MDARDVCGTLAALADGLDETVAVIEADEEEGLTGTVDDLAGVICRLQEVDARMKALSLVVADVVAHRMEMDRQQVEGGYLIREQKFSTKWRNEDARKAALRAIIYELGQNPADGKVEPHVASLIERTFKMVEQSFSIGQPKAPFRNVLGLDAADFCETSEAGWKVSFLSAGEAVPGRAR